MSSVLVGHMSSETNYNPGSKILKPREALPEHKLMAIQTRCPNVFNQHIDEDELDMVGFSKDELEHFGYLISLAGLLHYLPKNEPYLKYLAKKEGVAEEQAETIDLGCQVLDERICWHFYTFNEYGDRDLLSFLREDKLGKNDTAIYKKEFYLPISDSCSYFEFAIGFNHNVEPHVIACLPGEMRLPISHTRLSGLSYKDKNYFKTSSEDGWFRFD